MSEPPTGRQEKRRREGHALSSWAVPHWICTTYVLPCPGEARGVSGSFSLVGYSETTSRRQACGRRVGSPETGLTATWPYPLKCPPNSPSSAIPPPQIGRASCRERV